MMLAAIVVAMPIIGMQDSPAKDLAAKLALYRTVLQTGLTSLNEGSNAEFFDPIIKVMFADKPQLAERIFEQAKQEICPYMNCSVTNEGTLMRLNMKDFHRCRDVMMQSHAQAFHYDGTGKLAAVTRAGVQSVHVEHAGGDEYSIPHGSMTVRDLVSPVKHGRAVISKKTTKK